jgi:arabinogalactan endo-1,4-beta-galactosidase
MNTKGCIAAFVFALWAMYSCHTTHSNATPAAGAALTDTSFVKGADVSWLTQMEASNVLFYDSSGQQGDCMAILKAAGINTIRLRVWVNPANGWCDSVDVLNKAKRAKAMGLRIMIDFHYSDVWADPGHQTKPAAWASLSFNGLTNAVYTHTFNVLTLLKANGITPGWVQVGNEVSDGMLWNDGRASVNMGNFAALITAGYTAVKAVNDSISVVVHLANGFDNASFRWMFDGLKANGAKWDVIGMSLYPNTTNWPALDSACLANMNDMVSRYGSKVMICEVGMPADSAAICLQFLADIVKKTRSVANSNGLGVLYWEPESYNWEGYKLGAFDSTGKITVALNGLKYN